MHRVLILGCGFGGLEAAKALAKAEVEVTVVDRTNHHLFQPLLYQVATAGLAAPSIAAPIRYILRDQKNATVLMQDVAAIDAAAKHVRCADGTKLEYDSLIVATGATHSYFGHDEWQAFAPGLKTLADAAKLRRHILAAFEKAEAHPEEARAWLSFIVIGAGPTGVEMAGTLVEIARHTLRKEFRRIKPQDARVLLVEGGPRILPTYDEKLSAKALRQLLSLGGEVRLNARVTGIDAAGVMIGDEHLAARTVIWAAGVQASPLAQTLNVPLDRIGRVIVTSQLSITAYPDVYVIGDLAAAESNGSPVPGVSPAAKQMGRCAAENILRGMAGRAQRAFVYRDYGALATIGRSRAIAQLGKFQMSGFPAWLFWLFVHIYFLIGFRNRVMVLLEWVGAYISFRRSARVI